MISWQSEDEEVVVDVVVVVDDEVEDEVVEDEVEDVEAEFVSFPFPLFRDEDILRCWIFGDFINSAKIFNRSIS